MRILIPICLFLSFFSCSSKDKISKSYTSSDCFEKYKNLSIKSILDSAEYFNRQTIEITGYYYCGFEASAISTKRNSKKETDKMIWVDFSNELLDSINKSTPPDDFLNKFYGKKIKIKGIVYTDEKGHLSQYRCSIKNVCHLDLFE